MKCRVHRCDAKRRRSSQFCHKHHGRYETREEPCNGEAHKPEVAGMIDNCMVCAPRWGVMDDTWRCVYRDKSGRQCIRVTEHHGYCHHQEPYEKGEFDVAE